MEEVGHRLERDEVLYLILVFPLCQGLEGRPDVEVILFLELKEQNRLPQLVKNQLPKGLIRNWLLVEYLYDDEHLLEL